MNVINHNNVTHQSLTQGHLRRLVNLDETVKNMLSADRIIEQPAFQYVGHDTMVKELEECMRRQSE